MSLDDFFSSPSKKNEVDSTSSTLSKKKQPHQKKTQAKKERIEQKYYSPTEFEVGQDINEIFLLDVQYNGSLNLAQCVFYHVPTRSLYRWNDNTNHKPYLLTMMSKEGIQSIPEVYESEDFEGIEQITKYYPLEGEKVKLHKVYGNNPLSIGGKSQSFRNFINPSFEADIRYHFNYVADRNLTPGTFYEVKNGELHSVKQDIGDEIREELMSAFKDEPQEEIEMLNDYMPLLFQDIPNILRCAFDIEVDSEEGRFPNTDNPMDKVISIALVDSKGRKICWILNTPPRSNQECVFEDIVVLRFDNELELLADFFAIVNKYPLAFSFNGDNFDCPYLINRAQLLGMNYSDIPLSLKGNRSNASFDDAIHVDLHLFFRQASIRIYAFSARYDQASLEELSTTLLGEGKLKHPNIWIDKMDLQTLVAYNVKDAELTLRLTQFDNNVVLDLMFILMRICKMPLFDFTRIAVSGWLQMWLIYEHRKRGYLIPRKSDIMTAKGSTATSESVIEGKKFQGAIVLDPEPGIWWDVHVLDFASLYPSIIKTRNLSYETILCEHEECKSNVVPEVGHYACTKNWGLFAIVLGFIRDTRIKWFKPRSSDDSLSEVERSNNQVIQSSLKVLINAGYGVFGSEAFDFYCPPVAESTTAYARDAITSTQNYVENTLGVRVLYGDTDSVFLYQPNQKQINEILEWGNEHVGVEMGTDYVFRYVVFSDRKKNYFGITKKGNVIVKGLMGKKSNTPKIIRDNFDMILEILKSVEAPEEFPAAKEKILQKLQTMVQRLESLEFDPQEVSIKMSLSKRLKEYSTWTQTVQAATQLLASDEYKGQVDIGTTLEFIKVRKSIPVVIPESNDLSFSKGAIYYATVKPIELVDPERDLDGKPIIEIAESTFSQILNSIGLSWNDVMGISSLDEFF